MRELAILAGLFVIVLYAMIYASGGMTAGPNGKIVQCAKLGGVLVVTAGTQKDICIPASLVLAEF